MLKYLSLLILLFFPTSLRANIYHSISSSVQLEVHAAGTNSDRIGNSMSVSGSGVNTTDTNGTNQGGASTYGYSTTWHHSVTISLSGFASEPLIVASINTTYHEAKVAGIYSRSATGATIRLSASRDGGVENVRVHWVAIGEASCVA